MELFMWIGIATILFFCIEWMIRRIKISDFKSRYVLVTGCDSGFGNAVAKKLDLMGFKVFACCLTKVAVKAFNELGSSNLRAIEMDITNDASIEKAMEIVQRNLPENKGLWAIVNNAGIIGGMGSIKLHSRQDFENTISVNLYGMIMVTKACLPLILKEKGRVVNTSSVCGRIASFSASYCVSKYGVEAFSDVLRRENNNTGIKVAIIEPGTFKTTLFNKESIRRLAEDKIASLPADIRDELSSDAVEQLEAKIHSIGDKGSPNFHQVADAYVDAITARFPGKRYLVGFDAKYICPLLWTLPECISDFYIATIACSTFSCNYEKGKK